MIHICVYMCRFITAEITVRHFSSHKNCVFGIRKLASKFRADGVPRVVVEIGYRARSCWAPRDARMTEYPAIVPIATQTLECHSTNKMARRDKRCPTHTKAHLALWIEGPQADVTCLQDRRGA